MVRFAFRIFLLSLLVLLAFLGVRQAPYFWTIPLIPFVAYLLAAVPGIGAGHRQAPPLDPEARRRLGNGLLVWAIVLLVFPAMVLIPLYYAMKSPDFLELHTFARGFATVAVEISYSARVVYFTFLHNGELGPGGPNAYATVIGLADLFSVLMHVVAWTYIANASTFRELAPDFVNISPKEHAKRGLMGLGVLAFLFLAADSTPPAADVDFSFNCRGCFLLQIPPLGIPFEMAGHTVLWFFLQICAACVCAAAYWVFFRPAMPRSED